VAFASAVLKAVTPLRSTPWCEMSVMILKQLRVPGCTHRAKSHTCMPHTLDSDDVKQGYSAAPDAGRWKLVRENFAMPVATAVKTVVTN